MTARERYRDLPQVTQADVAEGLRKVGLRSGQVAFVHSAMRTFGYVVGGAETIVSAFLDVLGPTGTLVMPTFTFAHEAEEDPIIDPQSDPSEMGIITETTRLRPDALRSTAYRHSFAAIGRRARVITQVDPSLSPFDVRSCFGVMLALNTQVVLLGMTYKSSTTHHFAEWMCDVPYRHTLPLDVRVRRPDGSIVRQEMTDYQPKPAADGSYYGARHPDFNRLGRMLEDRGLVGMTAVGNAAIRRFGMRDLVDLAQIEAAKDVNIFRTEEGKTDYFTSLDFGKIVISPVLREGAGREATYQWCVMDERKLLLPS